MTTADQLRSIGRDPVALEAFYREHLAAVQLFVARRVGDPHDAADLTADVFLAAIEASRRYRGDGAAPRAWLYGIARHVVAGHHRSAASAARAQLRIRGRALLDEDSTEQLAARIDDQRSARALLSSLSALPRAQRAVVELVAVDGLTVVEAASVLGISAGSARVRYHRARHRLAAALPQTHEVT